MSTVRQFRSLFGGSRASTDLVRIARAACKEGFAVLPVKAGKKEPACTLTLRQRKAADKAAALAAKERGARNWERVKHSGSGECSIHHAITTPEVAARIFKRMVEESPELNFGIEVGRSRMLVVDCDSPEAVQAFAALWAEREGIAQLAEQAPTVRSPGSRNPETGEWVHPPGSGHFHFVLPEGVEFIDAVTAKPVKRDGYDIFFKDRLVLMPPSVRPEGEYVLASDTGEAPEWLVDMVREHLAGYQERATRNQGKVHSGDDPISVWATGFDWEKFLEPDEWGRPGRFDTCGCEIWTRPGDDWHSLKSATAHDNGCTRFEGTDGMLHVWSSAVGGHVAAYMESTGNESMSKLQYVAWRDHGGDYTAAMTALAIQPRGEDYVSDDEVLEMTKPEPSPGEDEFWTARPVLTAIRDYARASRVSPWALFGCVLAMTACQVGPRLVLPALVGGQASLNLFVGLVAVSGGGKDAARAAARGFLWLDDEAEFAVHEISTGEGMDAAFTNSTSQGPVQFNDTALFVASEIDSMEAETRRNGSKLTARLRMTYMGAATGGKTGKKENWRPVGEHQYRCAIIASIQPERSGVLLDDEAGGTPQRWLWLPTDDPEAPDVRPIAPLPIDRSPRPAVLATQGNAGEVARVYKSDRIEFKVCEAAKIETDQLWLARLRSGKGSLDSHLNLTRLKVAAVLALLDGWRTEVTDKDWALAATVIAKSNETRGACQSALYSQIKAANRAKARAEADRNAVVESLAMERAYAAAQRAISKKVQRHHGEHDGGSCPRSCLTKSVSGKHRVLIDMDEALLRGVAAGLISENGTGYLPGERQP